MRRLVCLFCLIATQTTAEVTVFAAASLRSALQEIHALSQQQVSTSYAGSATLARQISQGAPADVFVSANADWIDWLVARTDIAETDTYDLMSNRLVLIGAAGSPALKQADLARTLEGQRIAIGHHRAVPVGIYAHQALSQLGLWDDLAAQTIETDNVASALRFVALGEVPYAITYVTDAQAEPRVDAIFSFPETSHAPIRYRYAQLNARAEISDYLTLLTSPEAQVIFAAHGFLVPATP